MVKTIKDVLDKAEELEWNIIKETSTRYIFSKYSPEGQDFNITIYSGENAQDFIKNIYECYYNFDVSEEVSYWVGEDGHGRNGAPYDIEDLCEDMKWCENSILELYNFLVTGYPIGNPAAIKFENVISIYRDCMLSAAQECQEEVLDIICKIYEIPKDYLLKQIKGE